MKRGPAGTLSRPRHLLRTAQRPAACRGPSQQRATCGTATLLQASPQQVLRFPGPHPLSVPQAGELDQLDFITSTEFDRLSLLLRPLGRCEVGNGGSPDHSHHSTSPMDTERNSPFTGGPPLSASLGLLLALYEAKHNQLRLQPLETLDLWHVKYQLRSDEQQHCYRGFVSLC